MGMTYYPDFRSVLDTDSHTEHVEVLSGFNSDSRGTLLAYEQEVKAHLDSSYPGIGLLMTTSEALHQPVADDY